MKECKATGIPGDCCRQSSNNECFWEKYAELESEDENLPKLLEKIKKAEGCLCKNQAIEIVQKRISDKQSLV